MIYYFIKITDNKNPSYFFIDLTTQKNYKNRICGLRSKAIQYYHTNQGPFRNIYDIFTKDYSFYKVDTHDFQSYKEAKLYTQELHDTYLKKISCEI